jgi:drug/metabolite transporter (DMT)-like permease
MAAGLAPSRASTLAGIGSIVVATACFAMLDTTVKVVGAVIPVLMALWFRYAIQAVLVTLVMLPLKGRALLRTAHPRYQLLRGCLLLAVSVLSFSSVQLMPVGEFTAIVMITPLAVTLLAVLWLGERIEPRRWLLVFGGFAGALMVVRPGGGVVGWASLLPLLMVFIYAWFQILTSRLTRTEDPWTVHFYTGWVGALGASVVLPFAWTTIPDVATFLQLMFIGLMGAIGHFLLILAYARAPASTLTPYLYGQIAFAMLCGWVVFGHVPGSLELAGIALIVGCGASASVWASRERHLPVDPPEA